MKKTKIKTVIRSLWIVFFLSLTGLHFGYTQNDTVRYYFAFSLIPTPEGRMAHYGIIAVYPDSTRKLTLLSEDSFILQASGAETSKANPLKENLWEKYGIKYNTFGMLWKLRYAEHPYRMQGDKEGWAKISPNAPPEQVSFMTQHGINSPSQEQLEFLKQYGIETLHDYFYGDSAFRLLQDMQNEEWISNYRNL